LFAAEPEPLWNDAVATQAQRTGELDALREQPVDSLRNAARDELISFGMDLSRLWNHPASTFEITRRILRTVLKEIGYEAGPHHPSASSQAARPTH
jgi:hypothetical protein